MQGRRWALRLLQHCACAQLAPALTRFARLLPDNSEDRGGTTVRHFCEMIHKSLVPEFQYALVWGTSSKHMPQRCVRVSQGRAHWQDAALPQR